MTDPITTPEQMREAAARLAEKRAKYTMEAIKNATASALVSNLVTVTEAKVAHFIAAEIRALPVAEPEPVAVQVRAEALEEAAQAVSNRAACWWDEAAAADDAGRQKLSLSYEAKALACIELAAVIRVLKEKPE